MGKLWRVIGGSDKGGIVVREGHDLGSSATKERLATGAKVEELELIGDRLCFRLVDSSGPETGWVSIRMKDKELLVPELGDSSTEQDTTLILQGQMEEPLSLAGNPNDTVVSSLDCGRFARAEPVNLEIVPSGLTRRKIKLSIEEIEQRAEMNAEKAESNKQYANRLKDALEDLLYVARDRVPRPRIVLFIASLLQRVVKAGWAKASETICWQLCLASWASSLQDVEYFPAQASGTPAVLLCGFGGSHIDDVRPAAEWWVMHHGAAVIVLAPAVMCQKDQLETAYRKLMDLLAEGRPLVLHFCSDGGFATTRDFLKLWQKNIQMKGASGPSPSEVIKCIVADSAGLGNGHHGIIKDGTVMDHMAELVKDEKLMEEHLNAGAIGFFSANGINMLMHYGACNAFYEEPANSFGKALMMCGKNGVIVQEARKFKNTLFVEVEEIFLGLPILIISSHADRVVTLDRSIFMGECFQKLPGRKDALTKRWTDAKPLVLGEDGLGVHSLIFDKVPHCKGFVECPNEYWGKVDQLVSQCLQ